MRFLLLFISIFLYASQPLDKYSVVIGGPFTDALYDITQDHDAQISSVGFSQKFQTVKRKPKTYTNPFDYLESLNEAKGEQIRLIKLDESAQTTLDTSMKLPVFNRASSLIKTPANGYFIGGDTQEGELLVIHLDDNGRVLFNRQFGTRNFDRMHKLVALRDGGVLAVGSSITSRDFADPMYEQGLGLNDIYLTRFSKSGQKLWSKKYGTIHDDRGIDATEAYDGSILVVATTDIGKDRGITLMRLSENGDKIWLNHYGKSGVLNVYDLITLRDEHFLASLSYQHPEKGEQIRLVKFDLQQNLLAEHNITTDKSSAIYSIKEQSNGKIIGVGYTTDDRHINTDAFAISLDPLLKPLWQHNYGNDSRNLFRSVVVLRDGNVAAAGETVASGSEVTNMWIVKLAPDGSILPLHTYASTLYDALIDEFAPEIRKGEITITKDLVITLSHPALLFKAGVYELTPYQERFLKNFSPRLSALLWGYRNSIEGLSINGHTSSEWRGTDFTGRYLKNAKLSTRRSYAVLHNIFSEPANKNYQQWLSQILSSDGYAFAKLIKKPDEDAVKSRRVTFGIVLGKPEK
jgi:outer membrane protein OmpA-like peptidoglycan-associated protein